MLVSGGRIIDVRTMVRLNEYCFVRVTVRSYNSIINANIRSFFGPNPLEVLGPRQVHSGPRSSVLARSGRKHGRPAQGAAENVDGIPDGEGERASPCVQGGV